MLWAGTGRLCGVPRSLGLASAAAAELPMDAFSFLQISDSHIDFDKPENPNPLTTLRSRCQDPGDAYQAGIYASYGRRYPNIERQGV